MTAMETQRQETLDAGAPPVRDYAVAGQRWRSEIEMQDVPRLTEPSDDVDMRISVGAVPERLADARCRREFFDVAEGQRILLRPHLGNRMLLEPGSVVIDATTEAERAAAEVFILGFAFAASSYFKGHLPIHASAVAARGKAVLFSGVSGAGKSTLAARLARDGFEPLADDVAPVAFDAGGDLRLMPAVRRLRLWTESVDALDLGDAPIYPEKRNADRMSWRPDRTAGELPHPIGACYLISNVTAADPAIRPITGVAAFAALHKAIYRRGVMSALNLDEPLFPILSALATGTPLFQLSIPLDFKRLPQVVDLLYGHWRNLGLM